MLLIQPGFGLRIKKGHMFGERDSKRKILSIRLPFITIHWLNRESTDYWYKCARAAFNDPDWFIENHHAVRQAKKKGKCDIYEGISGCLGRTSWPIPKKTLKNLNQKIWT